MSGAGTLRPGGSTWLVNGEKPNSAIACAMQQGERRGVSLTQHTEPERRLRSTPVLDLNTRVRQGGYDEHRARG